MVGSNGGWIRWGGPPSDAVRDVIKHVNVCTRLKYMRVQGYMSCLSN
jgi:hypothetical protein